MIKISNNQIRAHLKILKNSHVKNSRAIADIPVEISVNWLFKVVKLLGFGSSRANVNCK